MTEHSPTSEQLQADLDAIPFREPIVADPEPGRLPHELRVANADAYRTEDETLAEQWRTVTVAAGRAILGSAEVRQAVGTVVAEPLSEELPRRGIQIIAAHDERVRGVSEADSPLNALLAHPPVPDSVIFPSVSHAPHLMDRTRANERLRSNIQEGAHYPTKLGEIQEYAELAPGISLAERRMVLARYRMARETKLLGLMAALRDSPIQAPEADGVSQLLPNGIKVGITAEAYANAPELLDPSQWKGRRMLKDRVHAVRAGDNDYIMKERKTDRHQHTKRKAHDETLTSEQEFKVASSFAELGETRQGDVRLNWEKPLGYVEFPDGYQFCMFESEPNILSDWPAAELQQRIIDNPDEYAEEYQFVRERARQIFEARGDLMVAVDDTGDLSFSFQDFAELRVGLLRNQAHDLYEDAIWKRGYVNNDAKSSGHSSADYAYRIGDGNRAAVEVVGFDFEDYSYDPDQAAALLRERNELIESGKRSRQSTLMGMGQYRDMKLAAACALNEKNGWPMPPKPVSGQQIVRTKVELQKRR